MQSLAANERLAWKPLISITAIIGQFFLIQTNVTWIIYLSNTVHASQGCFTLQTTLREVLDLVELNYLGNLLMLPIVVPNTYPNLNFLGIPIDLPLPPLLEQLHIQIFVSTSQTLHVLYWLKLKEECLKGMSWHWCNQLQWPLAHEDQ